jgi:hypothetical protein
MCGDAHRSCMIFSSVEIGLNSIGFICAAAAIKYQDEINEAIDQTGITTSHLDINAASAMAAFFL